MRLLLLILVVLLSTSGCSDPSANEPPREPEDYGDLAGLKATTHPQLRDEYARIVEEEATPEALCRTGVAAEDNVAVVLLDLYPPKRLPALLEQTDELFPAGRFEFRPIDLQKAINFRKANDEQRLAARGALRRTQCDMGIQFKAGNLADMSFIDVVRICSRLEAFRAAEALFDKGDVNEAVQSFWCMLRLAECLGAEKHLSSRLEAAFLRTEAFVVLQEIVHNEQTQQGHLETLCDMVQNHLAVWPDDANAWIGDRAVGMHTYEMVRDGNVGALLTLAELDRYGKEGVLKELDAATKRDLDEDEFYYLSTMRRVIESCGQPYFERVEVLDAIRNELQEKRSTADFPLVAGRMLLPGIEKGHAIQAQDRANWEAWALALSLATGRKLPSDLVNPLVGVNYQYTEDGHSVVVGNFGSGVDGDYPEIHVPIPKAVEPTGDTE